MTDSFVAASSRENFDLSQCKTLRTIKLMASSMDSAFRALSPDAVSNILGYALSTITAPSFFQVVIVYLWHNFHGVESWRHPGMPLIREVSQVDSANEALGHHMRFRALHEAHKARNFQLVLSVEVWDPVMEYSVRMLKQAVEEERAKDGFGGFLSEPLVTCHPRRRQTIDDGEVVCDEQSCTHHI